MYERSCESVHLSRLNPVIHGDFPAGEMANLPAGTTRYLVAGGKRRRGQADTGRKEEK